MFTKYLGKKIKDMKDGEVIDHVEGLYQALFVTECYGAKDMELFNTMVKTLEDRGYEVTEEIENTISINKCA